MATCPRCGRGIEDGARFCAYCGAGLADPITPQSARPPAPGLLKRRRAWLIAGIALVVVVVAAALGVVYGTGGNSGGTEDTDITTKRTLPAIQAPEKLSYADFSFAMMILSMSPSYMTNVDRLRPVIASYPNWNEQDRRVFDSQATFLPKAAAEMLANMTLRPSSELEDRYHLYGDWSEALTLYSKAMPMLVSAVQARDADVWDEALAMMGKADDLFSEAVAEAQVIVDYGRAGNVSLSDSEAPQQPSSTPAPLSTPSTAPATTAGTPDVVTGDTTKPSSDGETDEDMRPSSLVLAPAGKSMVVGDSFTPRVANPNRAGAWVESDFTVRSIDPTVASVDGRTVTASGPGTTWLIVEWGGAVSEIINVEVFADTETYIAETDHDGGLYEGPIYFDGRMSMNGWVKNRAANGTVTVALALRSRSAETITVTPSMFDVHMLSGDRYQACIISGLTFYDPADSDGTKAESWSLATGAVVAATLTFTAPSDKTADQTLLGFQDGTSFMRFELRDFEDTIARPW